MPRTRRLPQHEFVQHPDPALAHYTFCCYPDPDNPVSGICGMGPLWHDRDAEERAAEAEEEAAISNPVHPDREPLTREQWEAIRKEPDPVAAAQARGWVGTPEEERAMSVIVSWPSVPVTPKCTVHGVEHDTEDYKVRIYNIQTASGKEVRWYLCDQVAMQLELLPLP